MSGARKTLIDSMLDLRERLLEATPSVDATTLYYPPSFVEKARIFWGGAYRIEPTPRIPKDDDN